MVEHMKMLCGDIMLALQVRPCPSAPLLARATRRWLPAMPPLSCAACCRREGLVEACTATPCLSAHLGIPALPHLQGAASPHMLAVMGQSADALFVTVNQQLLRIFVDAERQAAASEQAPPSRGAKYALNIMLQVRHALQGGGLGVPGACYSMGCDCRCGHVAVTCGLCENMMGACPLRATTSMLHHLPTLFPLQGMNVPSIAMGITQVIARAALLRPMKGQPLLANAAARCHAARCIRCAC